MSESTPPYDSAAEQSVLGAMLLSREAVLEVSEVLSGADFYRPAHETVYRTILALHGAGKPVDAITVTDALTSEGEISRVGGVGYMHELMQACPTSAAGPYYAEIVAKAATRRRLAAAGQKIVLLAQNGGDEADVAQQVVLASAVLHVGLDLGLRRPLP